MLQGKTKTQQMMESNRVRTCFTCDICFPAKQVSEIGGALYYGNLDTAKIVALLSTPVKDYRNEAKMAKLDYVLNVSGPSSSTAIKTFMEAEAWHTLHFSLLKEIFRMEDKNPFNEGEVVVTSATKCLITENPEAELNACSVWTNQVISACKPKGIVVFGDQAMEQLVSKSGIEHFEMRRHASYGPILFLPSLLPMDAGLLDRNYSQKAVAEFYERITK